MVRIMTYNAFHCEDITTNKIDFKAFASFIKSFSPDICSLNEIRGQGEKVGYTDQAAALSSLTSMEYYFGEAIKVGGTSPYGNAVLFNEKPLKIETIKIPDPERVGKGRYETRCIIRAEYNDFVLINTHMGLEDSERINAVNEILKLINFTDKPIILTGDFNDTPDSKILKPLFDLLSNTADLVQGKNLTFPSKKPEITIDYILYRGLKCTNAFIPNSVLSDHFAIIADFEEI